MFENMGEGAGADAGADRQGRRAGLAGSAGAVAAQAVSTPEVKVQIVHAAVGGITESDINLAIASKAVVIGFNTRADAGARKLAEGNGVDMPLLQHHLRRGRRGEGGDERHAGARAARGDIGTAEIRTVFVASKIGTVAGCMVTAGQVTRNARFRLLRDNVVIYTGELESLKRMKDDVREVKEGFECGIKLKNYNDIKEGDQLEFFEVKEVARTL
jgi:translation initiation factor IF-2